MSRVLLCCFAILLMLAGSNVGLAAQNDGTAGTPHSIDNRMAEKEKPETGAKFVCHQDKIWDTGAFRAHSDASGEHRTQTPTSILQGGDNISDATIIPSIPFSDAGTTMGYANDYTGSCGVDEGAPDVVYSFTPSDPITIDISLCYGSRWNTRLYVFENSDQNEIACNDDACGGQSEIHGLPLTPFNTYYIVIDGYGTESGSYTLNVTENIPCQVSCPPGAIAEGEPDCGPDYIDNYNGGCNSIPPVFQDVNVGDTICGTSGTYISQNLNNRDTDWFRVNLSERAYLNLGAVAEFDLQILILADPSQDCGSVTLLAAGQTGSCDTLRIQCLANPGVYYLWVGPSAFEGWECPLNYVAWVTTSPAPPAPPNDNCEDVTPVPLIRDVPLEFSGDNTGATLDCLDIGGPEVWHAFTTSEVLDITIDYCLTDPGWNFAYTIITDGCPCANLINATSFNTTDCGNGNYAVVFRNMLPGTYYYPINYDPLFGAAGPYTITVTAVAPTCEADFQVVAPGSWTGNTCGAGDDCTMMTSDDHIYEVTIVDPGIWTFSMCNGPQFDAYMGLGTYCCIPNIATADDECQQYGGGLIRAFLDPGIYYLMIEGWNVSDCGEYQLDITYEPPVNIECPPNAIPENEPACGPGYVDEFNGGCNSNPPVFLEISPGDTVCGTSGTYISSDGRSSRDTDWYHLSLSEPGVISWKGRAAFPLLMFILNPGSGDCRDYTYLATGRAEPGEELTVTAAAEPGDYWLWIGPSVFDCWPCPLDYVASVSSGNPDFAIAPTSVSGSAAPGGNDSEILTVTNTGTGDLQYYIDIFETPSGLRRDRTFVPVPFTATAGAPLPIPTSTLQGGDNISDATIIPSIPFSDAGTTDGYTNDYAGGCGVDEGAPDVVYSFSPSDPITVKISLCGGSSWNTRLYVCENDIRNEIACNDDACGSQSEVTGVLFRTGSTYYIVVDGSGTESGDYTISVTEDSTSCQLDCPRGAMPEGEPDCGPDYVDNYNGGCNSSPPTFVYIDSSVTICGTTGVYFGGRTPTKDTDWYLYTPSGPEFLTLTGASEVGIIMGFIIPFTTDPCQNSHFVDYYFITAPCDTGIVTLAVDGSVPIIVFVAPDQPDIRYECGSNYWFTFTADPLWLSTDVNSGIIPGGGSENITVDMDASNLGDGTYQGRVTFTTNETGDHVYDIPVTFNVSSGGCNYVVGDANGNGAFNGLDVTYSVAYFKGGPPPPYECECTPGNTWYVAGDVNQSCGFNGLDVTYMVAYFKGGPLPHPCPDCPPARIGILGYPTVEPSTNLIGEGAQSTR